MLRRILLVYSLLTYLYAFPAIAQNIKGEVLDMAHKKPMMGVSIQNVYTGTLITTDENGRFTIDASSGQLIEFTVAGYKTAHVRIPSGTIPPYFKIILEQLWIPQVYAGGDWQRDSAQEYELYAHELNFPKMNTWDMIQHPFWAMSKQNQQIWDFQKQYEYDQQQKYIDYTFNKKLVTKLTGLEGDSLTSYMKRFRPTYQQARAMNEYSFYSYIRRTVYYFRRSDYSPGRLSR